MAKTTPETTAAAGPVPGLRVTVKGAHRVGCAGVFWAGVSELPAANFSARQLAELRQHQELKVEDIDLGAS